VPPGRELDFARTQPHQGEDLTSKISAAAANDEITLAKVALAVDDGASRIVSGQIVLI
jgi:hypothetical protein